MRPAEARVARGPNRWPCGSTATTPCSDTGQWVPAGHSSRRPAPRGTPEGGLGSYRVNPKPKFSNHQVVMKRVSPRRMKPLAKCPRSATPTPALPPPWGRGRAAAGIFLADAKGTRKWLNQGRTTETSERPLKRVPVRCWEGRNFGPLWDLDAPTSVTLVPAVHGLFRITALFRGNVLNAVTPRPSNIQCSVPELKNALLALGAFRSAVPVPHGDGRSPSLLIRSDHPSPWMGEGVDGGVLPRTQREPGGGGVSLASGPALTNPAASCL